MKMSIIITTRKRKLRTRCLLLRKQSLKERDAIGMDILGREVAPLGSLEISRR